MPKGVTQEDIFTIVQRASEGLEAQIDSINEDVSDCWFVEFKPDFEDKDMIADCIMRMREMDLMGQTIKARLKTEALREPGTTTTSTAEEMLVVATPTPPPPPFFPSNNERRRMPKKGRKYDKNLNHHNGGNFARKPYNKRSGNGSNSGAKLSSNHRTPPGVDDSHHFPVLGNNDNHSQFVPQTECSENVKQATPSNVLPTDVVTKVDTEAVPVNETREIHGAYAAALLRCATNTANVDSRSATASTTVSNTTKKESTVKTSSPGCWVRVS